MLPIEETTPTEKEEIDTLRREVIRLRRENVYDTLTGLYNLRSPTTCREVEARLNLIERADILPDVLYLQLDLDGLHPANKLYSVSGADRILEALGKALSSSVRNTDIPFREGGSGDEFGVVLFGISLDEIDAVFKKIDTSFLEELDLLKDHLNFRDIGIRPSKVTSFSAGVVRLKNRIRRMPYGEHHDFEDIFAPGGARETAHRLVDLAKKAGKNQYIIEGAEGNPIEIRPGFVPPSRTQFD